MPCHSWHHAKSALVQYPAVFTGEEMNLSFFGESEEFIKDEMYMVPMPALVATEHKQQVKDAYKRGGLPAVQQYHQSVIAKIKKQ